MKNTFRFLVIALSAILFGMPVYAQEQAKKKVAVYMTGSTSNEAYKKVIGAKLVNAITESNEYAAVERTADFLNAIKEEEDYGLSGEVRDSQIARLGQKFGVRYVVVADVSELFDEYFITARMINVETGLVVKACDVNGPAESMAQLISLSQNVARGLLSYIPGVSKEPIEMSLCAVWKNKVVFITKDVWGKFTDSEKKSFEKKGICLSYNGKFNIVSMETKSGTWYDAKNNYAPGYYFFWEEIDELNYLLRFFGGLPLLIGENVPDCFNCNTWYWTSYDSKGSRGEIMTLYGWYASDPKSKTYHYIPVYPIEDIMNGKI